MTTTKLALCLIAGLTVISLVMGVVHWLAVPEVSGAGARDLAPALRAGHPRWAAVIECASRVPGLQRADYFWQYVLNAPRNRLLGALNIGPGANVRVWESTTWEPTGWGHPVRNSLVLAFGTVVIYSPVLVAFALFITTLRRRRTAPAGTD